MLAIHDDLSEATDNNLRGKIWITATAVLIEELINQHIEDSDESCSGITFRKMQQKWGQMKLKYKTLYSQANLQTGLGGLDPSIRWKYYDKMGTILVNDASIRPDLSIESHGLASGSSGPVITDNRAEK